MTRHSQRQQTGAHVTHTSCSYPARSIKTIRRFYNDRKYKPPGKTAIIPIIGGPNEGSPCTCIMVQRSLRRGPLSWAPIVPRGVSFSDSLWQQEKNSLQPTLICNIYDNQVYKANYERLTSLGIIGGQFKTPSPLKPFEHHGNIVPRGLRAQLGSAKRVKKYPVSPLQTHPARTFKTLPQN